MRGELYRDQQSSVSPSWLINGKSRYAIRTITQLDYHIISKPRTPARLMLLVGAVLSIVSLRYVVIGAEPVLIPFIMLTGSLVLVIGSACALRLARSQFRVDVTLQGGTCLSLTRVRQAQADSLLEALSDAVDDQQGSAVEQPGASALSASQGSQRQQSVAVADTASSGAATPTAAVSTAAVSTGAVSTAASPSPSAPARNISPVIATEQRRLRDRAVRLCGLLATLRRFGRRPADSA